MRDTKNTFTPVVIKQEPSESTHQDCSNITNATTTASNNCCNNDNHLQQDSAIDLRSTQRGSTMIGRPTAVGGASDCHSATYESTEEFVAQIARRVREESSLRGLELTPVAGLGPLADLKASAIQPIFSGPSSGEGGGKSRGEYACGECSSRFETARDYRAHCLTHQVLKAESRLRSSRGGELEGRDGQQDEPANSVFGGLGPGVVDSAVTFSCEDCDTRFSSRDTYAMHMLIRAKNEACFPGRSLANTGATTAPAAPIVGATNSKNHSDSSNTDSNGSNRPSLSPASSLSAATPLPGPSLLLNRTTPPELMKLDSLRKKDTSRARGETGRHGVTDNSHQFLNSLGLDLGPMTDYGMSWWSKYMPWMTGTELVGGTSSEGEGPAFPMVCYLCGELFSSRDSLAMHVLFHTRDMPVSAPDNTSGSWRKPRPSLSTLPSVSSSANPATLLGHVAMRHLQQRDHFNDSVNCSGYGSLRDQRPLSPTQEAVASAAAAAMAAITPPLSSANQNSLMKGAEKPDFCNMNGLSPGGRQTGASEVRTLEWQQDFKNKGNKTDPGHFDLALPQRGASAPIPTTISTSHSASPISFAEGGDKPQPGPGSEGSCKGQTLTRPLSADHVVLRQSRPLLITFTPFQALNTSSAAKDSTKRDGSEDLKGVDPSRYHGPHPQYQQQNSAFNVYRLQRLKALRHAKGVYRRPGTRGRPPMTIYGTAGRKPLGTASASVMSPHISVNAVNVSGSPSTMSSPCSSSSTGSMVQLLTSQGHKVSACSHCELVFGDRTLYQLHMGLHNVNNPWQCNACGCVCSNRLHFATHTLHY